MPALEARIRTVAKTARRCTSELAALLLRGRDLVPKRQWCAWATGLTGLSASVVSRLATAEKTRQALPPEKREQLAEADPLRIYAVRDLLKDEEKRDEAIDLVQGVEPEKKLYQRAAEAVPEQHREAACFRWSVLLPESLRPMLDAMRNKSRFQAPTRYGDEAEFVEWLLGLAQTDPYKHDKVLRAHEIADYAKDETGLRALLRQRVEQIESGDFGCELWGTDEATAECGGLDWSATDPHHTTAKSVGGHGSRILRLCRPCHEYWQPRAAELREALGIEREGW